MNIHYRLHQNLEYLSINCIFAIFDRFIPFYSSPLYTLLISLYMHLTLEEMHPCKIELCPTTKLITNLFPYNSFLSTLTRTSLKNFQKARLSYGTNSANLSELCTIDQNISSNRNCCISWFTISMKFVS